MRYGILAVFVTLGAVAAVGCAGTTTRSGMSSPTSSATSTHLSETSAAASGPVLEVTIAKGTVTPVDVALQARVGQPITVHVTSDVPDELHVHSTPDREFIISAAPGQTFTFTIDKPGKVSVELHHLDQTVATIDVSS